MSLPIPSTSTSLQNITAIVALDPNSVQISSHPVFGEIVTFHPNNPSNSTLFIRLLELFKKFSNSAATPHTLEDIKVHLETWASLESTGKANALLSGEISHIRKANIQKREEYSSEQCQKILSLIVSVTNLYTSCLKHFSANATIIDCEKMLLNNNDNTSEKKNGRFILHMNLEISNSYLFALALKHCGILLPNEDKEYSIEEIKKFLIGSKEIQIEHHFEESDHYVLKYLEAFLIRQEAVLLHKKFSPQLTKSLGDFFSLYDNTSDLSIKFPFFKSEKIFFESLGNSLSDTSNPYFSENEVSSYISHTLSNVQTLFDYHDFYNEIWGQLSQKTRRINQMSYKKHALTFEPLPFPKEKFWHFEARTNNQSRPTPSRSIPQAKPQKKTSKSKKKNFSIISQKKADDSNQVQLEKRPSQSEIKSSKTSFTHLPLEPTQQPSPFLYDSRVSKYFDKTLYPQADEDRRYHGFAQEVDRYILKYGIEDKWENPNSGNQDPMWRIPAEFRYDGTINRGEIIYCFYRRKPYFKNENSENCPLVCYHRFFHRRASSNLQEFIESHIWESNFTSQEKLDPAEIPASTLESDQSKVKIENDFLIEIDDPRNDTTILLFVVSEDYKILMNNNS